MQQTQAAGGKGVQARQESGLLAGLVSNFAATGSADPRIAQKFRLLVRFGRAARSRGACGTREDDRISRREAWRRFIASLRYEVSR